MEDKFQIDTPNGTFVMTKSEFYETFANVIKTKSYRENRIYHYPVTPQKAMKYRID